MRVSRIVFAVAALVVSHAACASELVASLSSPKSGTTEIALEIASDGTVAGFSFVMDIGTASTTAVRTSECVARLPKGFNAACAYRNGQIKVIAYAELPGNYLRKGNASVGSVTVSAALAGDTSVRVSGFETSGDNGVSAAGTAKTVLQLER